MLQLDNICIEWLGQSAFKIKAGIIIYIDPFKINDTEKADIVLITHSHYDHCSVEDLKKVAKTDTVVVAPPDCLSLIRKVENIEIKVAEPFQKMEIRGILLETFPAYNLGKKFHQKINGWLGYVLTINNKRIYHAGDTDVVPEMNNLKNIDLAMLPVGGTYTMNAEEAAQAVKIIKPKIAVPMHFGSVVGSENDAARFKELAGADCEVKILERDK